MESEIEFTALVTGVRHYHGQAECRMTDGKSTYSVQCHDCIPGRVMHIRGIVTDFTKMQVSLSEKMELSGEEEKEALRDIESAAAANAIVSLDSWICNDETAKKMRVPMEALARRILAASKLGRFVLLRFHNDADGISGAFALTSFLRCRTYQQNSAVYSARDAVRDLGNLHNESWPLVILLDFGANKESSEGIKILKAAGIEVIIIDHHPPNNETLALADLALTPWQFLGEERASRYVAGYLASEIAMMCGGVADFARVACAGDKSEIIEVGEEDKKKALVLDYLAANSSFGNNLDFYKSVLKNDDLFHSLWLQADEKIGEAASALLEGAKPRVVGELQIHIFDLDRVVIPKEFPNRSKVATRMFEILGKENVPLVVLGYGDRTVIMRANAQAIEKKADLSRLASEIRASMKDFVLSGGGHSRAAALQVKEGFAKLVIEELIRMLGG
ncbi:MAG: DHH family phosphoesterase [Candidatus Micrarchaeota archaeon]